MSENPEYTTETTHVLTATPPVVETPAVAAERPANRLYKAAAWVGIVAATVFVIAVIFFTGVFVGRHAGGNYGHHWGPGPMMMDRNSGDRGPGHGPGMWGGPWGPGGPGGSGNPGNPGPGNFGPGGPGGPGQPPSTPGR